MSSTTLEAETLLNNTTTNPTEDKNKTDEIVLTQPEKQGPLIPDSPIEEKEKPNETQDCDCLTCTMLCCEMFNQCWFMLSTALVACCDGGCAECCSGACEGCVACLEGCGECCVACSECST